MNLDMIGLFQGQRKTEMMRAHNCVEGEESAARSITVRTLTTRSKGKV